MKGQGSNHEPYLFEGSPNPPPSEGSIPSPSSSEGSIPCPSNLRRIDVAHPPPLRLEDPLDCGQAPNSVSNCTTGSSPLNFVSSSTCCPPFRPQPATHPSALESARVLVCEHDIWHSLTQDCCELVQSPDVVGALSSIHKHHRRRRTEYTYSHTIPSRSSLTNHDLEARFGSKFSSNYQGLRPLKSLAG